MPTAKELAFSTAIKNATLEAPWSVLDKYNPYDAAIHAHALRSHIKAAVRLYQPVLSAVRMLTKTDNTIMREKFRIVEVGTETTVEMQLRSMDTVVIQAIQAGNELVIKAAIIDGSGVPGQLGEFDTLNNEVLSALILAILPAVLKKDMEANAELHRCLLALGPALENINWTHKTDVPSSTYDLLYYLDIVPTIITSLNLNFGTSGTNAPDPFTAAQLHCMRGGRLWAENCPDNWCPAYVQIDPNASPLGGVRTIGEAKARFAQYSDGREWTPMERMMIPTFPDDTPIMPEVWYIAKRICDTEGSVNPVCNFLWRGITSYGKSTGIKQLACILNMPLLIQTCHTNMEAQELKSSYVPASQDDGLPLCAEEMALPGDTGNQKVEKPPYYADAMAHLMSADEQTRKEVLDASGFLAGLLADTEAAMEQLTGKSGLTISPDDACWLYTTVYAEMQTASLGKMLKALSASEKEDPNKPQFKHILAPYIKAMVNGYMVELQEISRIRDSGVLVSINEMDHPGALIQLMNGAVARRHKKAICAYSDNVGYSSCRAIDQSVIRRFAFVLDSYELTKEQLLDRVRRNTGCKDESLMELAYNLWEKVDSFCKQNSITEGSVSATELERFVQAVMYDGPDSIRENLDSCIISKASSDIEDQRQIRTACDTLVPQTR